MSISPDHINEWNAAKAFSKQAPVFDQLYAADSIIRYKRQRVRDHILNHLETGDSILELNCGSGEDAIFFAKKGFSVHATDISAGMLHVVQKKMEGTSLSGQITTEQCSFTRLDLLKNKKSFDYVFSNFGGLNCTAELDKVLHGLDQLVRPGGVVTLVIISRFCFWETLLLFKGKFRTAFRRFFSKRGRKAQVEGNLFRCWYYSPSFVKKHLQDKFDLIGLEALCTIVPPSYIENFAENHPGVFAYLKKKENVLKDRWPFRSMGDYFIISFRKK